MSMASFGKMFSCFMLFLLFSLCHQTEARESRFFSKDIHLTNTNYVKVTNLAKKDLSLPSLPSPSPALAPVTNYISNAPTPLGSAPTPLSNVYSPSPSPSPYESESSYYGLYGKDANDFVSDTNTILGNEQEKNEFSGQEFSNEDSELLNSRDSNKFVNPYPNNLNEENELGTSNQERYSNNLYNSGVGYTSEPQGMSDTRLVDNSKYYYGSQQDNNVPFGEETKSNNDGYSSHYDPKSKYEFDTMEEYEKQEGYPEYPQEFNP